MDVVGREGIEREQVRENHRSPGTIVGAIEILRLAYQARGRRELHPVERALNLPRELYWYGYGGAARWR